MNILMDRKKSGSKAGIKASVLFFTQEDTQKTKVSHFENILKPLFKDKIFKGGAGESFFLPLAAKGGNHLILVGLGKEKNLTYETVRKASATALKELTHHGQESGEFLLETLIKKPVSDVEALTRACAEGAVLASFQCRRFKQPDKKETSLKTLVFSLGEKQKKQGEKGLKTGKILGECTNITKTLASFPGNFMTPTLLANEVQKFSKGTKIKITIWNKEKIKKEKMGGLIGVSQGSSQEPRFIVMEYKGAAPSKNPVCLVGKGVTFDSGGISLKPGAKMDEMKFDMCGAAAVIGTLLAIEKLKLKVNVLGIVAATENMPDAAALKPGDIITARNGKTMEILNTDAEGRLILADALCYASEQKPQAIFDAATLTGAIVVALGNLFTGFFTKNKELKKRIEEAGQISGERLWPLPLVKEHTGDMKSEIADIANISPGYGAGSSTAAAFLEFFVDKKIPWAHFDIAGTAYNVSRRLEYCAPKMASGVMVRTFVEIVRSFE